MLPDSVSSEPNSLVQGTQQNRVFQRSNTQPLLPTVQRMRMVCVLNCGYNSR
jgi:hypothetical protein